MNSLSTSKALSFGGILSRRAYIPMRYSQYLNFFLFGILYNAAAFAVLRAIIDYNMPDYQAVALNYFRDYSFILGLLLLVPLLRYWGYKRMLLIALSLMIIATIMMTLPISQHFIVAEGFFALTGLCFSIVYVSGYTLLLREERRAPRRIAVILRIEGVHQIGLFVSFLIFAPFAERKSIDAFWSDAYLVIVPLVLLTFLLQFLTRTNEDHKAGQGFHTVPHLRFLYYLGNSLVWICLVCILLLIVVRENFFTWIHTLDAAIVSTDKVQIYDQGAFAFTLFMMGLGMITTSFLLERFKPFTIFTFCLVAIIFSVILTVVYTRNHEFSVAHTWQDIPPVALLIPWTAFFIGPILPLIYGSILNYTPKNHYSILIAIMLVATFIGKYPASQTAVFFYENFTDYISYAFTLIPMALLFVMFFLYYFDLKKD
ncbi:MAG: hypothetical protein JJT94_03100 [Bernardetiaceae bacterium]|nr:hypothetical protein [Bernardetiaceae bacterium]